MLLDGGRAQRRHCLSSTSRHGCSVHCCITSIASKHSHVEIEWSLRCVLLVEFIFDLNSLIIIIHHLDSGLQSVVLYSLPELDGAIDTVVLGGLVGDKIALVPERVRKLCNRLKGWIGIRKTLASERKISIMIYGFPPNVGAVGTAGTSISISW